MNVRAGVRPFAVRDREKLVDLFEEMQEHYGLPVPDRRSILADLSDLPPGVGILIHEVEEDGLLGFAAFAAVWPDRACAAACS